MQSSIHDLGPRSNELLLQLAPDDLFRNAVDKVLLSLEHFLEVVLLILDVLLLILLLHSHGRFELVPFGINDRLGNAVHMIKIVFWELVAIWAIALIFLLFGYYTGGRFIDDFSVVSSGGFVFGHLLVRFHLLAEDSWVLLIGLLNIMGSWIIRFIQLWRFPGVIRRNICHRFLHLQALRVFKASFSRLWHYIASLLPEVGDRLAQFLVGVYVWNVVVVVFSVTLQHR